jgi:hypothetical protein
MRLPVVSLLLLLNAFSAFSQWRFGIAGGINLGMVKADWTIAQKPAFYPRFGYSLGFGSEFKMSEHFSLLSNLDLVSKNYAIDPEYYGKDTEGYDRYSFLYLDMPVRICYANKNIRFFAGPFIDYCISGTKKYNLEFADSTRQEGNWKIKSGKRFASNELENPEEGVFYLDGGFLFGIGYRNNSYCFDLSYASGLVNVYPYIAGDHRSEMITHTRLLTLNLFFYL